VGGHERAEPARGQGGGAHMEALMNLAKGTGGGGAGGLPGVLGGLPPEMQALLGSPEFAGVDMKDFAKQVGRLGPHVGLPRFVRGGVVPRSVRRVGWGVW